MAGRSKIVLQPEYIKGFNCIGSECEDSCCIGWRVDVDKKSYFKYQKIRNEKLKPIIKKSITRNRSQNSDRNYAKIKMNSDGRCPFLNEANLCNIYIHAGEEYLYDVARFYPRYQNKIDGKLERSMTMSWPEVARLSLLNSNGITFEHIEEDDKNIRVNKNFDTEGHLFINKPQRYFGILEYLV